MLKSRKGEWGYFRAEKIRRLLMTILMFAIPIVILISGILYFKTKNNLMTIVAMVGIIPAAMSFVGLAALVIYFGLDISGLRNQGDLFANIAMYMQTLIFVTVLMLPFYTTGLIYKIRRRQLAAGQPAPVRIVIGAIVALALAIIIKKGLGFLFPGL